MAHAGVMTGFSQWIDESGLDDVTVAAAVKVDRTTIYRVRLLKRKPSRELLEALIVFSERMVAEGRAQRSLEANDFFPRPTASHQEPSCSAL